MIGTMMPRLLLILGLACLPLAAKADPLAAAAARYQQAHRQMVRHTKFDGQEVDASQAAVVALRRQWAAARDLVAALLDRDPAMKPAALARQARRSAGLDIQALRLDPNAMLVAARSGEIGTAFILRRSDDGAYRAAFALDAPQGAPDSRMPELAAWLPSQAGDKCRDPRPEHRWSRCGPLAVEDLVPLPNEAGGTRRFAVLAHQVTPAGGTIRYQVSIWRWDGRVATPLLARTLFGVLGDAPLMGQDARGFTLGAEENYQSLNVCGECHGRQMIWRFDLPATGATPPRIRSLSLELDLVDRFYTRLFAHQPATDIAAPAVIARLHDIELDMMNGWRDLGTSGGARLLCLDALGFDQPQIFHITRRAGRAFIADVTFAQPHACDGPGSHG